MSSVVNQSLAVFSHTSGDPSVPTPDKLALEGKIVQKADCRPINNSVYMNLKKETIIRAIEPTRKAQALSAPVNTYKPVANHKANIEYEFNKKKDGKKSRDDKQQVMEVLFALFEKHQVSCCHNSLKLFIVWKFHDFFITQILREIDFGGSRSSKAAVFVMFRGFEFFT